MPLSTPGDLLDPGIEPESLASPGNGRQFLDHGAIWELPIEIQYTVNVVGLARPQTTPTPWSREELSPRKLVPERLGTADLDVFPTGSQSPVRTAILSVFTAATPGCGPRPPTQ